MGSRKSELTTRLEEEDRGSLIDGPSIASEKKPRYVAEAISDENFDYLRDFDVEDAWNLLMDLPGCYKVVLDERQQKDMGLKVGVNVSSEFPWKQVKCKVAREYLPDEPFDTGEEQPQEKFPGLKPDDWILFGYASALSGDDDVFLVYTTPESTKRASDIIKTIETYQRWVLNKAMVKKGNRWVSLGSEAEVELGLPREQKTVVDVEIQSVYPIKHSEVMFRHRFTGDVRDGYVELVPGDKKFQNVFRKRIDAAIQSAPKMVSLEQQTDPTFPSNAWSQYLYEINPDDEGLDPSDDDQDEDGKKKKQKAKPASRPGSSTKESKTPEPAPVKPPPEMSDQVKALLETLEFNQVDMYRNDYPLISSESVTKYSVPYLKEILCFANISRSINRYVCAVDWYPTLSGLLVTSYSFTTLNSIEPGESDVDVVKRAVVEPNPVLMWSFDDSLHHKFEFETPREVTCLSFCPYDENILVGGTMNGQVIIWDMQNRVARGDVEEVLTASQIRYRNIMQQYLNWTKSMNEAVVVRPAAVSALSFSHAGPVTSIKWLAQGNYITATGQARVSEGKNRFFVSCSIGGTIAFWNLDAPVDKKRLAASAHRNVPKQLIQDVSEYKKYDRIFRPQYIIEHKEPLTSMLFNRGKFEYLAEEIQDRRISVRVAIKVKPVENISFEQHMVVSTMLGNLHKFVWEGFDFVQSTEVNKELVQASEEFVPIHDGPVFEIRRNPFCDSVFASCGKCVLAIWKEGCWWAPIFWRKRPASITRLEWSLDRPSILYLCRSDGTFEAWDLLARTDEACLVDMLGGGIITSLTEHCPIMAQKIIGVGDYNSSFRILVLPPAFKSKLPMEAERLVELINREETRKEKIRQWENAWLEKNADILNAKKRLEEEAQEELERLAKEAQLLEEARLKREAEEARKSQLKEKKKLVFDLPERLEKKWDDMNLRRLVSVLMTRRLVDHEKLSQQTAMEKERLLYERSKKAAIKKSFRTIGENVASIRARLLPVIVENKERFEMVSESAEDVVDSADNYEEAEKRCDRYISTFAISSDIAFSEFLDRGRQRRAVLNKSLGATTARKHFYNTLKENQLLDNFNFGFGAFMGTQDDGVRGLGSGIDYSEIYQPQETTTDADESSPMEGDVEDGDEEE